VAAAGKEIGQCFFSRGSRKNVGLIDSFPGKAAAFFSQLVAKANEFLLFPQELAARVQSFKPRDDFMLLHLILQY
jgi:hypothetical protein